MKWHGHQRAERFRGNEKVADQTFVASKVSVALNSIPER